MLSRNAARQLGRRLRSSNVATSDLAMLNDFKKAYDPFLVKLSTDLTKEIQSRGFKSLITSRSKQNKSIIRKLKRPDFGSDLYSIADLIGIRIITSSLKEQEQILNLIVSIFKPYQFRDYRKREEGYRCVHIYVSEGRLRAEIQVRTLIQHLWADESEYFGEQVKRGGGPLDVQAYLIDLSKRLINFELSGVAPDEGEDSLYRSRRPLSKRLPTLDQLFKILRNLAEYRLDQRTYLIIFDLQSRQLVQSFAYALSERDWALTDYSRHSERLPEFKYDIVILGGAFLEGARVTHARFFPDNEAFLRRLQTRLEHTEQ